MKCNILWLYPIEMNLYGDRGNLTILSQRLIRRGFDVHIDELHVGDEVDLSQYDLIYMGGGPDKEQHYIYQDCLNRKDAFQKAYESKTFFLLICGGYQLFGQYYMDQDNQRVDGVGLFDYYTVSGEKSRCIGNLIVESECLDQKVTLVGFENHGGQTLNVNHPLGKTMFGHGNQFGSEFEGYREPNVLGTYMHGPLLSKNPELADDILLNALRRRHEVDRLDPLDDSLELETKKRLVERFMSK